VGDRSSRREALIREHLFKNCPQWRCQQKPLWTAVLEETRKLPGPTRGRDRTEIAELLADERCRQAVLVFLATRCREDVRPTCGRDGAASEASEWENRECEEQLALLRDEEARLGVED